MTASDAPASGLSPTLKAALWMIGAIVSFSAMAVAGREAGAELDTFEIMLDRSAIGFVIVAAILTAGGHWGVVRLTHIRQHILRNCAHFAGQNFWLFAVTVAPLAQVFAIEFTTPLWVILLSPLLLSEKLTGLRLLTVVLGFIGILIVARPSTETFNAGLLAAATAAIFFALTLVFTKRLTRVETIGGIIFWLTLIQLFLGLGAAGYDGDIALPSAIIAPYVLVVALGGLAAHYCVTNALSLAPASVVTPIDFARLPTIAIVGMLLYGEPLDIWVFVGAALIFAANYVNIVVETRKLRVAPISPAA